MIERRHDYEIREFDRRRTRPWSKDDTQRLVEAVDALIRSHRSVDLPNGEIATVVDGKAYWALLGARDRAGSRDDE